MHNLLIGRVDYAKSGRFFFTVTLKQLHVGWGDHRYTNTREPVAGEGYIPIPRKYAQLFDIYNSNLQNAANNLYNVIAINGAISGRLLAQGCSQAGDAYAKQFAIEGDLKEIGRWYRSVGATVGGHVEVKFVSPVRHFYQIHTVMPKHWVVRTFFRVVRKNDNNYEKVANRLLTFTKISVDQNGRDSITHLQAKRSGPMTRQKFVDANRHLGSKNESIFLTTRRSHPLCKIDPVERVPRTSTSLPTSTIWRNISLKFPAMVISSTGCWV